MQNIATERNRKSLGDINLSPNEKKLQKRAKNTKLDTTCLGEYAENCISEFGKYLLQDGKSPKTVASYTGDVRGFLVYLAGMNENFQGELKRFQITAFRNSLVEEAFEPVTINKKINSLQSFNRFLIEQGTMSDFVIDLRKDRMKVAAGSEKQVETYDEKQLDRLLFSISRDSVSKRDRAIILILLYTGVRVSELCDIKMKNIDFLTGHLKVIGKGGKVREVPMKAEVIEAIKEYMIERNSSKHKDSEYLFLGQRGALQRDAVNTMLEGLTTRAKLDFKLKPHAFRHTFCTRLIQKGVPLTTVSKLAGHSSIDTTARFYINSSKEEKMRAVSLL